MSHTRPTVLFAAGDLSAGTGGIATLSRQVVRSLLEMNNKRLIKLHVCVLKGAELDDVKSWAEEAGAAGIRWFGGKRWRFSLAVATAQCDLRLFDHAGLARLQGASPLWRGRYVLLVHGVEMWRAGREDYHRTARKAEALVSNSHYTARLTNECCPGLPPISVCWPGTDRPAGWAGDDHARMEGIGPHAMLIVGRLDTNQRHKGHDHLLKALPRVLESIPDAQLVIAGDGDDLGRLIRKAKDLGVDQQVVFTGRVVEQELHSLYKQCALFVMPSDGDGFGLVFLEAMMHRLPCVGLAGSAAGEIFEHGVSGMLVDRENRQELADCLSGLLADDERRRAIGEAGHSRWQAQFTGACHAARFQDLMTRQLGMN